MHPNFSPIPAATAGLPRRPTAVVLSALLVALLSACGGGGGSSSAADSATPATTTPTITPTVTPTAAPAASPTPASSPSAAATPTPTPGLSPPSVSLPANPYSATSAEAGGWDTLQTARLSCGFGQLSRDIRLDAAALAHARYQINESWSSGTSVLTHYETNTANAAYSGYRPWDRSAAQGYGRQVAEILEATTWNWDTRNPPTQPTLYTRGQNSMRSLLNTVYHLQGALYEGLDVGFGALLQTQTSGTSVREEYRFGSLNGFQTRRHTLGAGVLATYPCEGLSNVPHTFTPMYESPNPFPSLTSASQTVGPPIYLKADAGQVLTLNAASLSDAKGNLRETYLLNNGNDPQQGEIGRHEAFIVPSAALASGTTYTLRVTGSVGSTPFDRSLHFTTQAY